MYLDHVCYVTYQYEDLWVELNQISIICFSQASFRSENLYLAHLRFFGPVFQAPASTGCTGCDKPVQVVRVAGGPLGRLSGKKAIH